MGFILKFVLIILGLSWMFRAIFRYLARSFINNINGQQPNKKEKKQGDVNVENKPKRDKKIKKDIGEYVDYEEIN